MKPQDDLFSEPTPIAASADTSDAAHQRKVTHLHFKDAALSPAQKSFNRLLTRIDTLTRKLEATRTLADGHRAVRSTTLGPLEREQSALMRDMVLLLADRLQRKGLTRAQKQAATRIACGLSETLAMQGDAEMQALHDALSPQSLDEKSQEAAGGMRAMLEHLLGEPLDDGDVSGSLDDPEAVLQAAIRRLAAQNEAEKARRQGASAAKPKDARRSKAESKAEQQALDAQTALRTVYRQLASALHPDREPDPAERARKTALMSEANAAYERRDLVTLLQLRLRAEHLDEGAVTRMAKEKMEALTLLLKEQATALQHDVWTVEQQMREVFDLPLGATISAASLRRQLREQQQAIQFEIVQMQRDLVRVRDDAQFKRWLKEQIDMADDFDPLDGIGFPF
jgi:hypothetical protein